MFNINIPTRVGFQTPFTNITMDLSPPDILKDQSVIVGGIEQELIYCGFQPEMDMLNCAFAEVMIEGDAKANGAWEATCSSTLKRNQNPGRPR